MQTRRHSYSVENPVENPMQQVHEVQVSEVTVIDLTGPECIDLTKPEVVDLTDGVVDLTQ